jgi:hypothetical protein
MKGIHISESPDGGLLVHATNEWPGYRAVEEACTHAGWADAQWDTFWDRYTDRVKAAMAKAVKEYLNDRR